MSELSTAPAGTSAPRLPAPGVPSTYLTPADPFPDTLAELELAELHVLHSRITRQLEREYCTDPAGPHPVSADRAQELIAELDTRQLFLAPTGPGKPAHPRSDTPAAARDPETAGPKPGGPPAAPATERGAAPAAAEQSAPLRPGQAQKQPDALSSFGKEPSEAGTSIHDLTRLRPGEQLQIWQDGQLQWSGTVEGAAPALGVVWIRGALDGHRRLISTQDTELRSRHGG